MILHIQSTNAAVSDAISNPRICLALAPTHVIGRPTLQVYMQENIEQWPWNAPHMLSSMPSPPSLVV
jgi:hypothetical protein